jgi:hypothetical protein
MRAPVANDSSLRDGEIVFKTSQLAVYILLLIYLSPYPILPCSKEAEMAKVRSPNYPNTDLGSALAMARKLFDKDGRNRMPQQALAKHLGHESVSGPALGKIGALRAYGLIEGNGDELRVTDDAIHALMAPAFSPEKIEAMQRLAFKPTLFREIKNDFPTQPSEDSLRFWLVKRGYSQEAAGKATKAYLATTALLPDVERTYDSGSTELEEVVEAAETTARPATGSGREAVGLASGSSRAAAVGVGMRQAVFPLAEGDVTIVFPADLSADGFEELGDYLEIFLRKAKRDAAAAK